MRSALVFGLVAAWGCGPLPRDPSPSEPWVEGPSIGWPLAVAAPLLEPVRLPSFGIEPAPASDPAVGGRRYAPPVEWGSPIADYIRSATTALGARSTFKRGLHDLAVFEDKLYFGYGDADRNLGQIVPIALSALGGDPLAVLVEHETDEEEVPKLRVLSGRRLVAPGLDPTDDGFVGNLYRRQAGAWTQLHTIPEAMHVHDVAEAEDGALYAVGSGAASPGVWPSQVHAYLWRSLDGGESFAVVGRVGNDGYGDSRAYRLLAASGRVFSFGYKTGTNGRVDRIANFEWDAGALSPLTPPHPLAGVLVVDTATLDGVGVLRGMASLASRKTGAWTIDPSGDVRFLEVARGRTVVDLFVVGRRREILLLLVDGDDFDDRRTSWTARVVAGPDLDTLTEVLAFPTRDRPRSIAHFRGALWIGTDGGKLLRAAPP